ncbi:DUF2927 domain-containing protein [uncultured Arcticibacterium sp.]|uniref:DUF2927 domain-containing protein n=1 Tax=uncultured Arcticibacterium sp. TaxID=2173042 RepID=UPI0030FB484A
MKKSKVYIIVLALIITSCSRFDEDITPKSLNTFQKETIAYFKEIALGFEFSSSTEITRKWNTDMLIYVGGEKEDYLMSELNSIIAEINQLSTDGFSVSITADTLKSNFYIFLGSGNEYGNQFPSSQDLINNNWGLFNINWNDQNELYKGRMYVDIYRAEETAQKHLLREELTQSLGLGKDSNLYAESIFRQSWTLTNHYTPIDKELIRLLYHPKITSGLNSEEVTERLTNILLDEN